MPVRRPKSGDPLRFPASDYRAFADAAARVQATAGASGSGRSSSGAQASTVVSVRNDSGSAVARFAVLAITGLAVTPTDNADEFKNCIIATGDTPATADAGKFAVCLEPIADGALGSGLLAGVVQCQVEVVDEAHEYADVTDADATKLTSSDSGSAQILWKESGTGTKWAVVRLGGGGGAAGAAGADTDWYWFTNDYDDGLSPPAWKAHDQSMWVALMTGEASRDGAPRNPIWAYKDMEAGAAVAIRAQISNSPGAGEEVEYFVGRYRPSTATVTWSAKSVTISTGEDSARRDDIDDLDFIAGDWLVMEYDSTIPGTQPCSQAAARFFPTGFIDPTVEAPRRATMWHHQATPVVGGALIFGAPHTDMFASRPSLQSNHANGNSFTHSCFLEAGTYTFWTMGRTSYTCGRLDFYCDALKFATAQEWYSVVSTQSVINPACVESGAGVGIPLTITTSGNHVFKGVTNGKHASATDYYIILMDYWVKLASD